MAEGARGVPRAGPVRRLPVTELEAEPPVVRVEAAEVRQHPGEAGELHGGRLGERLGGDERRALQLAGDEKQVVERAVQLGCRRAAQVGAQSERTQYSGGKV